MRKSDVIRDVKLNRRPDHTEEAIRLLDIYHELDRYTRIIEEDKQEVRHLIYHKIKVMGRKVSRDISAGLVAYIYSKDDWEDCKGRFNRG